MKVARILTLAAVWLATIYALVILEHTWKCNLVQREVESSTLRIAAALPDNPGVSRIARRNLELLGECRVFCTTSVDWYMASAANERLLGRNADAVLKYERALAYDRRPEIYLNLGLAQLAAGQQAEGVRTLVLACIYNPEYLDEISDHYAEVRQAIYEYQVQIAARARKRTKG